MLKKYMVLLVEVVSMMSKIRAVYTEFLTKPVHSYKMKNISYEGTLSGAITEVSLVKDFTV